MAVNKVNYGDETLIDLTEDTVSEDTLLNGVTAHSSSGNKVVGTVTVPTKVSELTNDKGFTTIKELDLPANVKDYGAKGDGSTDDTTAFQKALAENRTVRVPDGEYILSAELRIRANCQLQLSQATVLIFTQTSGNCISMAMSACLKGEYATIKVPYEFTGNAISVLTSLDSDYLTVPPWNKWDPMWKAGRYITDVNIVKQDSRGFCYSIDGNCNGTALSIQAVHGSGGIDYVWGLVISGLKIAGAFSYGIRCQGVDEGWAHDMRIEAFIDSCEIGVSMENCNCGFISAIVQPRNALTLDDQSVSYAKHGIQLIDSTNTDLSGSRVWDWNGDNTLYTFEGEYQHIALRGQCRGTILCDYLYYETPSVDIRKLIYTDNAENLNNLVIINEPFTRWFKPVDGKPYFYNGTTERELSLKDDFNQFFDTEGSVANFINALDSLATPGDFASIFGTSGYRIGYYWSDESTELIKDDSGSLLGTAFIPVKTGDTLYLKGLWFGPDSYDYARITLYDSSFNKIIHTNRNYLVNNGSGGGISEFVNGVEYSDGEHGCKVVLNQANVAYITFNFFVMDMGNSPVVSINNEISYTQAATLQDSIKISGGSVVGTVPSADTIDGYHIRTASEGDTGLEGYITFIV